MIRAIEDGYRPKPARYELRKLGGDVRVLTQLECGVYQKPADTGTKGRTAPAADERDRQQAKSEDMGKRGKRATHRPEKPNGWLEKRDAFWQRRQPRRSIDQIDKSSQAKDRQSKADLKPTDSCHMMFTPQPLAYSRTRPKAGARHFV